MTSIWRSEPWAMSLMAWVISPTARPASSEEAAICCDAALTPIAERWTPPSAKLGAGALVGGDGGAGLADDLVDGAGGFADLVVGHVAQRLGRGRDRHRQVAL